MTILHNMWTMEDNMHYSYIWDVMKRNIQVIFGVKQSIVFWQFKKQSIYFQRGGKQFIYFEQNGKQFIYLHIFLNPPPPPPPQLSNGPPLSGVCIAPGYYRERYHVIHHP